jgi:uncharacterized protein (TIGR02757 family)
MQFSELKEKLDNLYLSYKHKFSSKDPVWNLHRFTCENDIETIGLITAAYSYGSVEQINRFIDKLLVKTGNKPYEFTINFQKHKDKKHLRDLGYRFNSEGDLLRLFESLSRVQKSYGSLKNCFMKYYNKEQSTVIPALTGFTAEINSGLKPKTGNYYHYLISSPQNRSTCKRMNLFLRWMVRKDEIDFGFWNDIPPSKLIMPVDTHIARISKSLGLIKRKSIDLKFALELTESLKRFDPVDPVKYDFALCHLGIDGKDFA